MFLCQTSVKIWPRWRIFVKTSSTEVPILILVIVSSFLVKDKVSFFVIILQKFVGSGKGMFFPFHF